MARMLEEYRRKRDFSKTQEPAGEAADRAAGFAFVVQKHAARRLHYDFRLEMDGVLKSWAVAKGPSLVAGEKRLAVHVEDHPLDYGEFEGGIPAGQYGAGTVVLWDHGSWEPHGDVAFGYAKGHLDFTLHGEKLRGAWHLVRMHGKPGEKRENWLLIKAGDEYARPANAPDILEDAPNSVKTGRSLEAVAAGKPAKASKGGAKAVAMPDFIPPALAVASARPPVGPGWLHEIKFDGYRAQAHVADGRVRLLTRGGLDWTAKFGSRITEALAALAVRGAILDGEIVAEDAQGAADFSALQQALAEKRPDALIYYVFDLLFLDGTDMRGLPLAARKTALRHLLPADGAVLRFSEDFDEDGAVMLRHACRMKLEGIISKQRDAAYPDGRSASWRKAKCALRQEFVVAGFVPGKAGPARVGSLVLGYYRDGELVHAGRCGTGFTQRVARDLFTRLAAMERKTSPFARKLDAAARAGVRFVTPALVAEVAFTGWTADGSVRHASYQGLREDKPAEEVRREDVLEAPAEASPARVPKTDVRLTHPERVYWADCGVTKAELAGYYGRVWERMRFFVADRPLSLVRCPDGVGSPCFFQKHVWQGASRAVHVQHDAGGGKAGQLVSVADFDGVMGLVQAGVLEIHPWGCRLADVERPDFLTMDLDPGEGVSWAEIVRAAEDIRALLAEDGLTGFVKTSGGKGLHVVAPLRPLAEWPAVKAYTKALAERMAREAPDRFVSVVTKAKRGGKILVDYLRNGRGQTAVAPYSTRAREGAPVSMPVAWDEIAGLGVANGFTVRGAVPAADAWAGFADAAGDVPRARSR